LQQAATRSTSPLAVWEAEIAVARLLIFGTRLNPSRAISR
jgi:hypothetical protein